MHPQMEKLKPLPPAEKLQIIEELWQDIESSAQPLELSPGVVAEARRRFAEFDADPLGGLDEDEVWRQVDNG